MCSKPKMPKIPEATPVTPPPIAPPPEQVAEAPDVAEGMKRRAAQAAKKRGVSALRIDLNVPSGRNSLNIPR